MTRLWNDPADFADDASLDALALGFGEAAAMTGLGIVLFRAGAAPWPVCATWGGCPLPQFGVPQMTHDFSLHTASHDCQNCGVIPV